MTDETNNLSLYNKVKTTDPKYTKAYSLGGGDSGTSVPGQYFILKATDIFGPIGIGWGYEIQEDRFDEGGPFIYNNETFRELTHTIKLRLWYKLDDKQGESVQYGHTRYVYLTSGGKVKTDNEYAKKSLTDAIKKCLVNLGFAGDIYLGLHDDPNYVAATRADFAVEDAVDKVAEQAEQAEKLRDEMANNMSCMDKALSENELKGVFKIAWKTAEARNSEEWKQTLKDCYDLNKERLNPKQNAVNS